MNLLLSSAQKMSHGCKLAVWQQPYAQRLCLAPGMPLQGTAERGQKMNAVAKKTR